LAVGLGAGCAKWDGLASPEDRTALKEQIFAGSAAFIWQHVEWPFILPGRARTQGVQLEQKFLKKCLATWLGTDKNGLVLGALGEICKILKHFGRYVLAFFVRF
jgi:hypothetical protein